eukprot:scaffold151297_cov18-Prasinocladus_malaysianus.AAC.1
MHKIRLNLITDGQILHAVTAAVIDADELASPEATTVPNEAIDEPQANSDNGHHGADVMPDFETVKEPGLEPDSAGKAESTQSPSRTREKHVLCTEEAAERCQLPSHR